MNRRLPSHATPQKAGSHPAFPHALPDISILESCPTPETGFGIGSQHEADGLREWHRTLPPLPALHRPAVHLTKLADRLYAHLAEAAA